MKKKWDIIEDPPENFVRLNAIEDPWSFIARGGLDDKKK
jgi:hypothetical protein